MTKLHAYLEAVARRKGIVRTGAGPTTTVQTNYAILAQLQDGDIPLLTEIIRLMEFTLMKVLEQSDAEEACVYAERGLLKAEELAASGSSATWGPAAPQTKKVETQGEMEQKCREADKCL